MGQEIVQGSDAANIIAEEERLYGQVQARVAMGEEDHRPQVGAADLDHDLLSLRDQIAEARAEDLPPLVEQMTRLAALEGAARRRALAAGRHHVAVLRAHPAASESGKTRDVLVGKRGFIDRASNVQIVDWRNAPVSRIYYRYEEGDDYEEEIAGRRVEGVVEARRNVSIARGNLRRIGTPQGTYLKDARGGWVAGGRPDRRRSSTAAWARPPDRSRCRRSAARASSASTTASRAPTRRCPRSPR